MRKVRLKPTRLVALGGIVLIAFLYWRPLHAYVHTKHELQTRQAEVHTLRVEQARLRRLGLVKPGEQLFIVKGIPAWRRKH
jgi:hypothetical protein